MKELLKNSDFCVKLTEWCDDLIAMFDDLRIEPAMSPRDCDEVYACADKVQEILDDARERDEIISEAAAEEILKLAAKIYYICSYYLAYIDEYADIDAFKLEGHGGYGPDWFEKISGTSDCFSQSIDDYSLIELWDDAKIRYSPSDCESIWWCYANCGYYSDWDGGDYDNGEDICEEIPPSKQKIDAAWFWENPLTEYDETRLWIALNTVAGVSDCPESRRTRIRRSKGIHVCHKTPMRYDYSYGHFTKQDYVALLLEVTQ